MLEFAVEPLTPALIEEIVPIQDRYWQETEGHYKKRAARPAWPIYMVAQNNGMLKAVIARSDGKVVGGAMVLVTEDPFCACVLGAVSLIYLLPEYRNGWNGIKIAKMAISQAKSAGAEFITAQTCLHNGTDKIFRHLGFNEYAKSLLMEV